jgi:GTP cyclohydrolase IA
VSKVNYPELEQICKDLLLAIGEDPTRPGLQDTPRRFASMWREFVEYEPGKIDTCFESITTDQMVVVSGMRVWSMCEHHLLPFWCDISIGYIAQDKVLGLSKFARIAHKHAHKLQLQERLCDEIATELHEIIGTHDIAVLARGEHLCMVSRGIHTPGIMTSSVMLGLYRTNDSARMEFLQLVKGSAHV